jgi:hypothetical protein
MLEMVEFAEICRRDLGGAVGCEDYGALEDACCVAESLASDSSDVDVVGGGDDAETTDGREV